MAVRTGATLHCVLSGAYGAIGLIGGDLKGQITSIISAYSLSVRTFEATTSLQASSLSYAYVAELDVQTTVEFSTAQDVLSIVQHAFYKVTGTYPASASVTLIDRVATGQAAPTPEDVPAGPLDWLGNAVGATADTVKWILIALVGLIVLVLLIVGYGPNVPKVARAVA